MPRIIELTPTALRSYGGNYDEYQRQRDGGAAGRARRWSMP
jgi:ATPase subunit of ABC transporter with duplicated ATPase domains